MTLSYIDAGMKDPQNKPRKRGAKEVSGDERDKGRFASGGNYLDGTCSADIRDSFNIPIARTHVLDCRNSGLACSKTPLRGRCSGHNLSDHCRYSRSVEMKNDSSAID